MLTEKKIKK